MEAAVRTYYLNCSGGNNSNSGLSQSQAWRTLQRANNATLQPGDKLLLKRGCTFTGTLKAKWNGTSAAPILIGAYGSGARPKIQNSSYDVSVGTYSALNITGSYLVIEYIEAKVVNPPVKASCNDQPIGFFVGFNFRNPDNRANGGSHNVLRYSKASFFTAGAHFNNNTHHDRVVNNEFVNNNVMHILTPTSVDTNDDIGAWGVLLKGHDHEVAFNYFANNRAGCTFDTAPQGNAVEVYQAQDSNIHHNTSVNDRVFSELGGSAGNRASGITYAYNLVISSVDDARFVVPRGSENQFGPTPNTLVYNNTVYYTGAHSQAVVCGAGCTSTILTARNNILWAQEKAFYGDDGPTESRNIFWNSTGTPFVQLSSSSMSGSSRIANPRFMNPGNQNFRLQSTSPAINAGALVGWDRDLANTLVPQGGTPDIGGYEFIGAAANIISVDPSTLGHLLWLPLMSTSGSE